MIRRKRLGSLSPVSSHELSHPIDSVQGRRSPALDRTDKIAVSKRHLAELGRIETCPEAKVLDLDQQGFNGWMQRGYHVVNIDRCFRVSIGDLTLPIRLFLHQFVEFFLGRIKTFQNNPQHSHHLPMPRQRDDVSRHGENKYHGEKVRHVVQHPLQIDGVSGSAGGSASNCDCLSKGDVYPRSAEQGQDYPEHD